MIRNTIALLLVAFAVIACETVPTVTYDRSKAQVTTLAVLDPGFPKAAIAVNDMGIQSSAGASGGLIGSLIGAAIEGAAQANRHKKLREMMGPRPLDANKRFIDGLVAALEEEGYSIEMRTADSNRPDLLETPSKDDTSVDAVLDVVTTRYGYIRQGAKWLPLFSTKVRLTDAESGDTLMQDVVAFNDPYYTKKNVAIRGSGEFVWGTYDGMIADGDRAVQGLEEAIDISAKAIAGLLR